jgi:VIT1/CCC1 family predicted Fe2+/Mn2+ transporter
METDQFLRNRVEAARQAYENRDLAAARHAHQDDWIEKAVHATTSGAYIADMVFGASDGIVTTFAVVSGVVGADLSAAVVLILGFANLFADGLSMAVGNLLSKRSERQYQREERRREAWEVDHMPEKEQHEVRQIYRRKGFSGPDLDRAVEIITADRDRWVDVMMVEELGIIEDQTRPLYHAVATFVAFALAGFVPLLAHVLAYPFALFHAHAFGLACLLTAAVLFWVGAARTFVTRGRWWLSGLEMLGVGGLAAAAAYAVGYVLKGLAS